MNKLKAIGAMCIALCVIFVVLIPTAVSYQDLEYMEWCTEKDEMSIFYSEMRREALSEGDWSSLKLYSDLSYNFYSGVLDEIDQFDVSPGYLSRSKDEDKAFYEDIRWAAYYSNKIADAYLSGEGYNEYYVQKAISYLESATSHNEKGIEYLEKYLEEIENAPRSTPKKIHTPKPTPKETSPIIIIDSDSDGVPDNKDYAPYDPYIKSQSDSILIWFGTFVVIAAIIVVAYLWIRIKSKTK